MSQYSCGNIIIILFMLKSGHYAGITWCFNYSIMTKSYAGTWYLTGLSGGLHGGWGGGGWDVWSSDTPWCFMLLQSRYALTVPALWLVLSISSPIHGSGLPPNPKRGRGWSCYVPFLLLHTSPIKISSCCAGPLACFNYLSCPGCRLPSNPWRGEGVGVEL